jgi:lysophospholipase L1-like esterase
MNDLLLDGMHPNDSGHAIIAEMLIKTIKIKTIK